MLRVGALPHRYRAGWVCDEPKAFQTTALKLRFLPIDLQVQDHILAVVKRRQGACIRLGPFEFRMNFIIRVGIQSAEPVGPRAIRKAAGHRIGSQILQKSRGSGDRVL